MFLTKFEHTSLYKIIKPIITVFGLWLYYLEQIDFQFLFSLYCANIEQQFVIQ